MGVLVMAHGGTPEWNASIRGSVAGLAARFPTAVAFGMADPATLAAGLAELADRGVERVAVVRMFLSGDSFLHQTEFLLGMRSDAPRWFVSHHGAGSDAPDPIAHGLDVVTHRDGIADSPRVGSILRDRLLEISRAPASESVLVLAHGVGDDAENGRLLARMREAVEGMTIERHRTVRVATLREDWADKRADSEREIRAFVEEQHHAGAEVVVLPFRLFGAGPYAKVLEGLEHTLGRGLAPHPEIDRWVEETAVGLMRASGWSRTGESLPPKQERPSGDHPPLVTGASP